jgi:diguanylate cyclase (GGDEF)-like protein
MTGQSATVLIVDDDAQNRKLLVALLRPEGYQTRTAASGDEALAMIREEAPDLVLLDIAMPGRNGFDIAERLKDDPSTSNIPIIMVSAQSDRGARLRGLKAGAEDFLTKPVDRAELWLRVRNLLRLKELSDSLQDQSDVLEAEVMARTADLHHLAHYDAMTGLPNRMLFYDTLGKTVHLAAARGWLVAVLFIDLDRFKNINDSLGHEIGDELLAQFSDRLVECVRIRDTVGRLGGDEFGLILLIDDGQQGAAVVAEKIRKSLLKPFDLKGHHVTVTASIGITVHLGDVVDPEVLIKNADRAMYHAKQGGRDTFRFFTPELNTERAAQLKLETALRRAEQNGEFLLHYQPKVRLDNGRIAGVEALLRWKRPGRGLVMPGAFIPTLEETGQVVRVGRWVIGEACRQAGEWLRSPVGAVQISVNVSARQLIEGDLEGDVRRAIEDSGIPAALLELELTETSLMANTELTIATLRQLRELGVKVSIDDFGTGYSSLSYLRRFPIDKLKIDIAFIRDITTNPGDAAIALTIIRMAHGLKLDVIAEGVETAAQLAYLRSRSCDEIQGFYASRPLAVIDMEKLLIEDGSLLPALEGAPRNTLLIVDQDPAIVTALGTLLRPDGYRVLAARSAAEGFELLAMNTVQVILCEHDLSTLSGAEFLDRVKELHPDVVRIILSAHRDVDALMSAINRGAIHRYYTKPWDDGLLRANIRDAFRNFWVADDARRDGDLTGSRPPSEALPNPASDTPQVAVLPSVRALK